MIFSWIRDLRRRRLLAQPFPEGWLPFLERLPFYVELEPERQGRLRDLLRVFVQEKSWEGCAGLEITDEIRVTVAAEACLLILELDHAYYQDVRSILVYPSAYRHRRTESDAAGVVSEGTANLEGETLRGGPVILSWDDVVRDARHPEDGRNLVYHEFAHKLDMLDGYADGLPPAHGRQEYDAWRRIVKHEYEAHVQRVEEGRPTFLGTYAATNPAEFFAVSTERFFDSPRELAHRHPDLHALLAAFYRQSPGGSP